MASSEPRKNGPGDDSVTRVTMVSFWCCHYAILPWPKIIRSCRGGKVAKRCGQFLAIPCAVTLGAVILMWEVEPSTVGFLDQRVTARFARNRKHPSIDHVEVSSEKQGSFSNDLTGKRAKPQHQSPFHLPPRKRDKCGILL